MLKRIWSTWESYPMGTRYGSFIVAIFAYCNVGDRWIYYKITKISWICIFVNLLTFVTYVSQNTQSSFCNQIFRCTKLVTADADVLATRWIGFIGQSNLVSAWRSIQMRLQTIENSECRHHHLTRVLLYTWLDIWMACIFYHAHQEYDGVFSPKPSIDLHIKHLFQTLGNCWI